MAGKKNKESTAFKSLSLIYSRGRGWCFSQSDFGHFGSRSAIDFALHDLEKKGTIRRIYRGLYDYPRFSSFLNQTMGPDMDQAARALARKFNWYIQPTSSTAQNLIGLSTQVAARYEYMSNGPNKTYKILEGGTLYFKTSKLKESGFKHNESSIIVQAIKGYNSKSAIEQDNILLMRKWLPDELKEKVLKDTKTVTGWVHDVIFNICSGG